MGQQKESQTAPQRQRAQQKRIECLVSVRLSDLWWMLQRFLLALPGCKIHWQSMPLRPSAKQWSAYLQMIQKGSHSHSLPWWDMLRDLQCMHLQGVWWHLREKDHPLEKERTLAQQQPWLRAKTPTLQKHLCLLASLTSMWGTVTDQQSEKVTWCHAVSRQPAMGWRQTSETLPCGGRVERGRRLGLGQRWQTEKLSCQQD